MQCQRRIESLTPEQQELLTVYRDRWIAIGLSTEPADRPRAEAGIRAAYEAGHLAAPERIVWCQSPLSQGLTRALVFGMKNADGASVRASIWDSIRDIEASIGDSVGASVRASIWDSVGARLSVWQTVWQGVDQTVGPTVGQSVWQGVRQDVAQTVEQSVWQSVRRGIEPAVEQSVATSVQQRVWQSVWRNVGQSVRRSVEQSVGQNVGQNVRRSVEQSVEQSVGQSVVQSVEQSVRQIVGQRAGRSIGQSVEQSVYGQHDAAWLAFYRYLYDVCGVDTTAPLAGMWEVAESAGWWLPHANLCWVSERPVRLRRDSAGRLHDEGDMAIAYPDGWGVYALHGVRVPAALVVTPASELDPAEWVLKQANAEIRREAVRKIGIERVCARLRARVIDRRGEYELLLLDLGDRRPRPYLKMRNPSVGTYHVEGVHPECTTVEQAVNWRASGDRHKPWHPEVLT